MLLAVNILCNGQSGHEVSKAHEHNDRGITVSASRMTWQRGEWTKREHILVVILLVDIVDSWKYE